MRKLCNIYNFGSFYRSAIYKKLDTTFNCKFAFGDKAVNATGIRPMNFSELKDVSILKNKTLIKKPFYWQCGMLSLLFKDYNDYILIGEPYNITIWVFLFLSKLYPKKRVFLWTHGWYGREGLLKKMVKKLFFHLANAILLYGNYARDFMIKEGFNKDNLFVIHNSLDYQTQLKLRNSISPSNVYRKYFSNDFHNLVFIGRLTKVKSLDMILKAMSILRNKGIFLNLVFIGDGDERYNLEILTKKLGLEENVYFYGASYDENINVEFLYNADLCVSPGNVGLTAIHSLMFGCPVITHNDFKNQVPEFESIVSGKTGDFFNYGDVNSLVEKIANWLATKIDREQIRQECFKEIDTSWNPDYQIKILKNALEGNKY